MTNQVTVGKARELMVMLDKVVASVQASREWHVLYQGAVASLSAFINQAELQEQLSPEHETRKEVRV